jgi:transglutaminase-like putative cysteine protease
MLRRGLCATVLLCSYVFAGVSVPDWVKQAAQEKVDVPADAKAVVLLDDQALTVRDNGEIVLRHRRVIKLLRPQGRDYANISVWFRSDRKILSLHGWSISPKGEEYEIKDKDFFEQSRYSEDLYSDVRFKRAVPPAADPGAVIAYESETREPSYRLTDDWDFQGAIPVQHAVYSLTLPPAWEYKTAWVRYPEVKPTTSGNSPLWELRNIPGIEEEPNMPSEDALAGRMSVAFFTPAGAASFNSWANIAKWYSGLVADRRTPTPEIVNTSQQLVQGKSSYEDKVKAIAAFMQSKIRYISVQIGIGGHQPHYAGDILQKHYGDCKDKATLMSTLLHQAGIESHYVVVNTSRGVVSNDAPSLTFDHVVLAIDVPEDFKNNFFTSIVKASNGKRYLIFDPTDEFTPVGMLHADLQQNYGLLVLNGTGELVSIPLFPPETNALNRVAKLKVNEDGTVSGDVIETLTGLYAWQRRYVAVHSTEQERRKGLEHFLSTFVSSFAITDLKYENLQNYDRELVVKYSFLAQGYAKKTGPLFLVRPRVLGSKIPEFGPPPRKNPFAFEAASKQVDEFTIELPSGYVVDELPDPAKIDVGFAAYVSKIESGEHAIHYSREYTVREVRVEKDRLKDFEHLAATISADERGSAVLKKAP